MPEFDHRNFQFLASRYIDYTFMRNVYKISGLTAERIKHTWIRKQYVLVSFGKRVFAYCESHMQYMNTLYVTMWSFLMLHKVVNVLTKALWMVKH
jgi:hypothetical protein